MNPGTQAGTAVSWLGPLPVEARDRFPPSTDRSTVDTTSAPLLGRWAVVPHRLRKLTVQGEFPGWPPTTRSLERCWSKGGPLLPHFSNSTWSGGQDELDETPTAWRWAKGPQPAWPKSLPGGSRMDGGWSSSERAKFIRVKRASLQSWKLGAGPRGSVTGAHRSAAVHSSRRESWDQ